jgi:hypothetical protein
MLSQMPVMHNIERDVSWERAIVYLPYARVQADSTGRRNGTSSSSNSNITDYSSSNINEFEANAVMRVEGYTDCLFTSNSSTSESSSGSCSANVKADRLHCLQSALAYVQHSVASSSGSGSNIRDIYINNMHSHKLPSKLRERLSRLSHIHNDNNNQNNSNNGDAVGSIGNKRDGSITNVLVHVALALKYIIYDEVGQ